MIHIKALQPFKVLYKLPDRTNMIVIIGGRGGAKTYEVSKYVTYNATVKKKRCVILRDEKALIKDTILNEIFLRYDKANTNGRLDSECEKLKTGIVDKKTGKELVYTKGFRASANEKKANMKGMSDIDIAVIEEAEDIIDFDQFNTFVDSLRKDGCIVIVILNTPDIGHFIIKNFFDTETAPVPDHIPEVEQKKFEGYFKITPKKNMKGVLVIQTDYKDNVNSEGKPNIPASVITRYESYGDPESNMYNPDHYMTDIKGYSSSGRKGQVLKKVKPISLTEYMALPFKEFYGQDFGTASPAGLVGVKFNKNNCYCRELNYSPMNTLQIAILYCTLKLNAGDRIVADNADEKAWKKLKRGWAIDELPAEYFSRNEKGNLVCKYPALLSGFHVVPCVKGADSVRAGVDLMDTMNLFAVSESLNLWEEIRLRIYAQDKYGNFINEPEPGYDHLQDPWMYVVQDQRGKRKFEITTG